MALKVRTTSPLPPRTTGRWTINRERQILICSPKSTKTTNRDTVWLLLLYLILCFICCIPVNVYCKDFLPRPTRLSYAGIIGKGTTTGNCTMCFPMPLQRLDTNSPGAKKTFALFHVFFFLYIFYCGERVLPTLFWSIGILSTSMHIYIFWEVEYCKMNTNTKKEAWRQTLSSQRKSPKKEHPCHSVQLSL